MKFRPGQWLLTFGLLGATGTAGVIAATSLDTTVSPLYISPDAPSGLSDEPALERLAPRSIEPAHTTVVPTSAPRSTGPITTSRTSSVTTPTYSGCHVDRSHRAET
jgi:hypothetical protein